MNQFDNYKDQIVKVRKSLDEAIEVGDLVKDNLDEIVRQITTTDEGLGVWTNFGEGQILEEDISELYTKQGDQYTLVAIGVPTAGNKYMLHLELVKKEGIDTHDLEEVS